MMIVHFKIRSGDTVYPYWRLPPSGLLVEKPCGWDRMAFKCFVAEKALQMIGLRPEKPDRHGPLCHSKHTQDIHIVHIA
jgi:hypothetical protein